MHDFAAFGLSENGKAVENMVNDDRRAAHLLLEFLISWGEIRYTLNINTYNSSLFQLKQHMNLLY